MLPGRIRSVAQFWGRVVEETPAAKRAPEIIGLKPLDQRRGQVLAT
jgi:hypothetical protein